MPASPELETFLVVELVDAVVGVVVLEDELLGSVLLELELVGVLGVVGVVGVVAVVAGVAVELGVAPGGVVRAVVVDGLVTGVSGMRVPATDDRAAEVAAALEPVDSSPGTVTGGRVAMGGNAVRDPPEAVEADEGEVADCPTALPQAASSNTVIPCPAAIRAVRRLRWEDTRSP